MKVVGLAGRLSGDVVEGVPVGDFFQVLLAKGPFVFHVEQHGAEGTYLPTFRRGAL